MSSQKYRLFLLDAEGRHGAGVVDITASGSDELPKVIIWASKTYVRTGSYSYTYHEATVWDAPAHSVTEIAWRVVTKLEREGV